MLEKKGGILRLWKRAAKRTAFECDVIKNDNKVIEMKKLRASEKGVKGQQDLKK